jgi:hypothetical protein
MLLRDDEAPAFAAHGAEGSYEPAATLQDDVERLIGIASQLISAIERQIRHIEESLAIAREEHDSLKGLTVVKEHFIQTAVSLNESLHEIAVRLEERTERSSLLEHSHA